MFLPRLCYLTLKGQSRNGVQLLKRLQATHMNRNKDQLLTVQKHMLSTENSPNHVINGLWQNELGSTMEMHCNPGAQGNAGTVTGKYRSKVGEAKNFYDLSGRYTMSGPDDKVCILGFSVAWNNAFEGNSDSTTSWTGIYYPSEDKIHTTWILTQYTPKKDRWSNSEIGFDVFVRK